MDDKNELEVNKKNREDYEQLMKESSSKTDDYYDKNSIVVILLLLGLLAFIAIGSYSILVPYFFGK